MKSKPNEDSQAPRPGFRQTWLNPRRKRFWAIFLVLFYTLFGFFAAPWLAKRSIENTFMETFGRQAQVEKVEINPYVLSFRMLGFSLEDTDGIRLAGVDNLFINFQLSSLFNRAWTFREISLDAPYFLFERFTVSENRLSRMLADMPEDPETDESENADGGLPRFLIHDLSFNDGTGDLFDNVPATRVHIPAGPIDARIQGLNTLPDRDGNQSVTIDLPDDATLSWQGKLNLAPLDSSGTLTLTGSRLHYLIPYLQASFPLEQINGFISAGLDYQVSIDADGQPVIALTNMQAEVTGFSLTGLEPAEQFLELDTVAVSDGRFDYPRQSLHVGLIEVSQPKLRAWLDENGGVSLQQLVPANAQLDSNANGDEDGNQAPGSSDWQISVDEIALRQGTIDFSDRSLEPAVNLGVRGAEVSLTGISNTPDTSIPFELTGTLEPAGRFQVNGSLTVLPALSSEARIELSEFPLNLGQPYAVQFADIDIRSGALQTSLEVSLPSLTDIRVDGSLGVTDFLVHDLRTESPLLGWQELQIDRLTAAPLEMQVHVSQVEIDELYGKLQINEDLTTNLTGILKEQGGDASEGETPAPDVTIGSTTIRDGSMDFADFSLPLPFATHISNLDGTLSTISTTSTEPANIRMEGQVDEFGLARINGAINLLDPIRQTDTTVEFRNLQMSNLSPYTAQFAGREIDDGKLDLDLEYVINNGQLDGKNDVVMSQLTLGKEVDSPDAANLPLGLAVALLKDADGVINVNLPVQGDINDPEFKISGVIWQAFTTLITKVVTAPFRLLGNLIGVDSEDFGQFQFLAGRSDMTPPELEKVAQLETALAERPELAIEIKGAYSTASDTAALKFFKLRNTVYQRLDRQQDEDSETLMIDEEVLQIFESLYLEQNPDASLDAIKATHMTAPPGGEEGATELDPLAYAADLRDRLLEAEPVTQQDLIDLGNARAEAIRAAFINSGQITENRLVMGATAEVESEDDEWVVVELGVATD